VPQPTSAYTARDTLDGRYKDKDVRISFHFDTLWRVDTVRVAAPTPIPVPVSQAPVRPPRTGARVDTVTIVRRDTLRVPGRRQLFVPPGQYPPEGQCRVRPPARYATGAQ
jgi:hypothetical protein